MPATITKPENLNPLEVIQVMDYMDKRYPNIRYSVTRGNDSVWVYWGATNPMNFYFLFKDGRISDVIVD